MKNKGLIYIIVIVTATVTALMYTAIILRNGDLEKQIKAQQEVIKDQEEQIKMLEEAVEDREMEISLWGHILDRLASNHPEEAKQIARSFGVQTEE